MITSPAVTDKVLAPSLPICGLELLFTILNGLIGVPTFFVLFSFFFSFVIVNKVDFDCLRDSNLEFCVLECGRFQN